jgi:cell division transport system ATP-binding protein
MNFTTKPPTGILIAIEGIDGAGKTTLFRLLSAADRPTSGSIEVAGFGLDHITDKNIPYYRRQIGVVFQDFRLLKDRTVFENVALPLEIHGETPAQINSRVREVLAEVGLTDKIDSRPEHLSGGEQQRVSIARAIVHRPGVLIADEPTGNLDPKLSEEIFDMFERINKLGTTIFVATHDHDLVERRKKRTIEINQGQIVKDIAK